MRLTVLLGFIIALNVATTSVANADELSVPPIITSGLAAYKSEGAQAAIKAWLKGSPLEASKEALSQANMLNQIHDFYGPYKSYEVIQVHTISASSKMVYLTIDCEQGAIFGKFLTFKRGDVWTVPSFKFNTEPDKILPYSLLAH
jgi:hypothetical protein